MGWPILSLAIAILVAVPFFGAGSRDGQGRHREMPRRCTGASRQQTNYRVLLPYDFARLGSSTPLAW